MAVQKTTLRKYVRRIGVPAGFAAAYSLAGFLALPSLVHSLAKDYVADKLHLALDVGHIEVNPWRLAVRLDAVSVSEPHGVEPMFVARSLYVNLDGVSSLLHWRAEVDDFDILRPRIHALIDAEGKLNLLKLVPPEDPDSGQTPWRLAVLGVHGGYVAFTDASRPVPFSTALAPLDFRLFNLASAANGAGRYRLSAETGQGERLAWEGEVAVNPVRSSGVLSIGGLRAKTVSDYLQDTLPVRFEDGRMDISGEYRFVLRDHPELSLRQVGVALRDLVLRTPSARVPLPLAVKSLRLDGIGMDWPAGRAGVDRIRLEDVRIGEPGAPLLTLAGLEAKGLRRDPAQDRIALDSLAFTDARLNERADPVLEAPNVRLDALEVFPGTHQAGIGSIGTDGGRCRVVRERSGRLAWEGVSERLLAAVAPVLQGPVQPSAPWVMHLGGVEVKNFHVDAEDRVPVRPVSLPVDVRRLALQPRPQADKPHAVTGDFAIGRGTLAIHGQFDESPVSGDLTLDLRHLPLPVFAPYLAGLARFQLESGELGALGRLRFRQGGAGDVRYSGAVDVGNFSANDQYLHERFLAWKHLRFDGVDAALNPVRLHARVVEASEPFTRLIILPDKTLNLTQILAVAGETPVKPAAKQAAPAASIDVVKVSGGSMLFADLSLKPQFATGIEALEGEIRGVNTRPGSRADIRLDGRVDQYGKAAISGGLNPVSPDEQTDVALKFDNVELTTLTPYSAKFAGYRIDKGKLSLDLRYTIRDRQLNATNKIVLNQLTLGEKVDSPDAVNLPLRLAVAILKDSHGVIDIDLPISGSLDDPQFRVGPLVWKAFVNVITKVATAPFRFIAGLVGGDEGMDRLAYLPGVTALAPGDGARLDKLAQGLQDRPGLRVEIRGVFDPVSDGAVLKARHINDALTALAGKMPDPAKALEVLYAERFGAEALRQQRELARRPAADGLPVVAGALSASLRAGLESRETVDDGELRQLALERARTARQYLVEHGKLEEARVFVLEPASAPAEEGKVVSRLELAAR